ncbi:hypothetical protein GETHLI_17330 [Geothrix limicola]|uniref:Peptidase S54 rhomboid domain-containing protein n=1 Tax=Geothrix limicola TaxID=2927978 RepID=A0ABQ5QFD4_9BACT|nr:rhomboid family intramembrane serine protease [Geothrix limicola]GLH73231.1 hypothetical protein GETHLI_17330 [Geothrix limicola]
MDPLALTSEALQEPWRLWTAHLVHFGWDHALANLMALAVPALLVRRQERLRLLAAALLIAPLLSLALLPGLGGGQYRGASGLACALWAWTGQRLLQREESLSVGLLLLGGLGLKLGLEGCLGLYVLPSQAAWRPLPEAHVWGALLGLLAAAPSLLPMRRWHPRRI